MKKVELPKTEQPEIDWNKPQWVQSKSYPDVIVLTTGEHTEYIFKGTVLPCKNHPDGRISQFDKSYFHPLTTEIPFIISNKD